MESTDNQHQNFENLVPPIKEMFMAYGLKNLSMDEISRKLGISKKTLYNYVRNKEELIEKVLFSDDMKLKQFGELFESTNFNAIEKLLKISQLVHNELKQFNPMIRYELEKYYNRFYESFVEKKRKFIYDGMRQNMEQGISEKIYRDDVNIDLVATIYINSMIDLHNSNVCKALEINFIQLFEVLFENHIRAISTPAGLAYFESRKNELLDFIKNN